MGADVLGVDVLGRLVQVCYRMVNGRRYVQGCGCSHESAEQRRAGRMGGYRLCVQPWRPVVITFDAEVVGPWVCSRVGSRTFPVHAAQSAE